MTHRTRHLPRIFMYHRFTSADINTGHVVSAKIFEWQLQQLQGRWNVISLGEYVRLCHQNAPVPPYTVIITIDDGYRDFYDVAYPLLKKYQRPATFFVTTAFVEGEIWLWHDRLHFAVEQAQITGVKLSLGEKTVELITSTREEKGVTWQLLSDYCVDVPDEEKWRLIRQVEEKLQVNAPAAPPDDFAAATWEQLREMIENGMEIGGHTVTHPVLSQIKPEQLHTELVQPKKIIEEQTGQPVATFCYPNGRDVDITPRVVEIVEENGYQGAVQGSGLDFTNFYRLPRLGVTNDRLDFLWKLYGFEQMLLK